MITIFDTSICKAIKNMFLALFCVLPKNTLHLFSLVSLILLLVENITYSQWIKLNVPFVGDARDFAVSDSNLFAGIFDEGVFLTTNNGTNWMSANYGLTDPEVMSLCSGPNGSGGTNIFAGTLFGGVYLSTNNGSSWTPVNNGLNGNGIDALAISSFEDDSANVFVAVGGGGVFLSTDNGSNWTAVNNGFTPPQVIYAINGFAVYGKTVYVASGFGVFVSMNNGLNWNAIDKGFTNTNVRTIAVTYSEGDTILFAGTFTGGAFRSTNNGRNWEPANTGLASKVIYCFAILNDDKGRINIFAGISAGAGVYLSTDLGVSWTGVDSGLATQFPPSVFALAICGGYLFAGTDDGVWRRPLSEMITSVPRSNENIPNEFVLKQNYPNPFNPVTSIQYSVPRNQKVTLKVFDLLGREVATLVNEVKYAGSYRTTFNGVDLASGVYFYRLQAGRFTQTRKLTLLR